LLGTIRILILACGSYEPQADFYVIGSCEDGREHLKARTWRQFGNDDALLQQLMPPNTGSTSAAAHPGLVLVTHRTDRPTWLADEAAAGSVSFRSESVRTIPLHFATVVVGGSQWAPRRIASPATSA